MKKKVMVLAIFIFMMLGMCFIYRYGNRIEDLSLPGVEAGQHISDVCAYADDNEGMNCDIHGFSKDGAMVLFLPTRVDASGLIFYALDENGTKMARIEHDFSAENAMLVGDTTVLVMQSSLPSVEISLQKGTLEEVEDSKSHEVYAYGNMVITASDEMANIYGCEEVTKTRDKDRGSYASMSIRGHGNISWKNDKKGYNVFTENEMSILGMKPGESWVLLANAEDYSLLRNEVFLELAQKLGIEYTPECRQVDLFVDGEYRGLYLLTERVEVSDNSVNIRPEQDYLYRWGMYGKGGYTLSTDVFRNEDTKVVEVIDEKKPERVEAAYSIAQSFISAIENTASDEYLEQTDLDSFARYYWIQEFAKNTDATSRSFYTVYRQPEGKMYVTSVWDMDRTAGAIEPFERAVDYIYPTGYAVREEEWFVPLFAHADFSERVDEIYAEENLAEVFRECAQDVYSKAEYIRPSANMNFTRWDVLKNEQNNQIVRYMGESTFDTQVEWLAEWLRQRTEWFEENSENSQ